MAFCLKRFWSRLFGLSQGFAVIDAEGLEVVGFNIGGLEFAFMRHWRQCRLSIALVVCYRL